MVFTELELAEFEENARKTAELSPKEATLLLQRIGIVTKRGTVSKKFSLGSTHRMRPAKKN